MYLLEKQFLMGFDEKEKGKIGMRAKFSTALKEALKSKDKVAMGTIRLILSALKDRDISVREQGNAEGISDGDILLLLQSMLKQRQESAKIYADAGRDDLVKQEEAEIAIIKSFMPKQLDDSEVEAVIFAIITDLGAKEIKDMGKVMAVLKEQYAGQVDMGRAGGIAKKKLS